MKTEILHDCPKCRRKNFTERGLRAHNCKSMKKDPTTAGQEFMKNELQKPSGSTALVDMTLPQITEACSQLEWVEEKCSTVSGICAVLQGLLLRQAKEKLGHGKFIPWVNANFKKSKKTAAQRMRLAGEFSKSNPRLLFSDLAKSLGNSLQALESNQLDMKNPVVASVAAWTAGKSCYQLLLDLEPAERGGWRGGPKPKDLLEDSAELAALDIWTPTISDLEYQGLKKKTWANLPMQELRRLHSVLIDLSKEVGAAVKGGKV